MSSASRLIFSLLRDAKAAVTLILVCCAGPADDSLASGEGRARTEVTSARVETAVIAASNPDTTTHSLTSRGGILGISANGGGYINYLRFPGGSEDIVGPTSSSYGRGGQSTLRDELHSRVYNPTQAGFNEDCGTPVTVVVKPDQLVLPKRRVALWKGDGKYDFTADESICADPYDQDGGNTDVDAFADPGGQASEVTSNFDYNGSYRTCESIDPGVTIPCWRHYHAYGYRRGPGNTMAQFHSGLVATEPHGPFTEPVLDTSYLSGWVIQDGFTTTKSDLASVPATFSLRFDTDRWEGNYNHYYIPDSDSFETVAAGSIPRKIVDGIAPLIIVGSSSNPNAGRALGIYRSDSHINNRSNIRFNAGGEVVERFDRTLRDPQGRRRIVLLDNATLVNGKMHLIGIRAENAGILHPSRTQWQSEGIYEALHAEYFILLGTPREIVDNAKLMHPM